MYAARVENVSKKYSQSKESGGVFNLNIDIEEGGFISLLGRSGSGKTTTLRLLAGFLRPTGGKIELGGKVVASRDSFVPTKDRDLAMVFQSYALWPHMSVMENVAFGLRVRKINKTDTVSRVREALRLVGMEDYAERKPGELSGGQQQRVALARSIVLSPKLLLLDEPLSNLDAELRVQMRNQLIDLQEKTGITFVYVTHDQDEALALSTKIILLENGRIIQAGTPEELYFQPDNLGVAEFLLRGGATVPGKVIEQAGHSVKIRCDAAGAEMDLWGTRVEGKSHALGQAVSVVLRPEIVRIESLDTPMRDGWCAINGIVKSSSFVGREDLVQVNLDTGHRIFVPSPARSGTVALERVRVVYPQNQAVIVSG
jgi:iron(III) transport system ATP-binding protein